MANSPLTAPVLREDLPLYPHLIQLIRVTAATVPGPSGVSQMAGVAGSSVLGPTLYVAFVEQLRTDGLIPRDREPCLADDVRGDGLEPGYYLGRLAGSHNSLPVYEIADAGASTRALDVQHAYCINPTPTDGRFDARLQVKQADGTYLNSGERIWLREAHNVSLLVEGGIYICIRTGYSNGRKVYQVADYILQLANADVSQLVQFVYLQFYSPNRCWDITEPSPRAAQIKRLLIVKETDGTEFGDIFKITFDPATNWDVNDVNDDGEVIVQRELIIREGTTTRTTLTWQVDFNSTDFDVSVTASGHAAVTTEGYTGSFDVITNCVAGVLKVRCLTFTRGLLKTVGAERDLGSGSCP